MMSGLLSWLHDTLPHHHMLLHPVAYKLLDLAVAFALGALVVLLYDYRARGADFWPAWWMCVCYICLSGPYLFLYIFKDVPMPLGSAAVHCGVVLTGDHVHQCGNAWCT